MSTSGKTLMTLLNEVDDPRKPSNGTLHDFQEIRVSFDDFHDWSAGAGNYKNESECRSVWNSIKDGGVTASSLFHAAKSAGWQDDTARPRHERPQPRQKEPEQPKATKPPPHGPMTLWSACTPATAAHEYVTRKLGLHDGLREYHGNPCQHWLIRAFFFCAHE
jgi:hypothetical protein